MEGWPTVIRPDKALLVLQTSPLREEPHASLQYLNQMHKNSKLMTFCSCSSKIILTLAAIWMEFKKILLQQALVLPVRAFFCNTAKSKADTELKHLQRWNTPPKENECTWKEDNQNAATKQWEELCWYCSPQRRGLRLLSQYQKELRKENVTNTCEQEPARELRTASTTLENSVREWIQNWLHKQGLAGWGLGRFFTPLCYLAREEENTTLLEHHF